MFAKQSMDTQSGRENSFPQMEYRFSISGVDLLKNYFIKWRILIVFSIILVFCSFAFLLGFSSRLVTGKKSELSQITLIENPYYPEKSTEIIITNDTAMDAMYNAIAYSVTSTNRRPNHNESLQFDADFLVIYHFQNANDEVIIYRESAYRFLETHGGSGDPGYIRGNAKKILFIIRGLITEKMNREAI